MRTYRVVWAVSVTLVLAWCVVLDLASGGLVRLAMLCPLTAFFGGFLGFAVAEERPDKWTWTRRGVVWASLAALAVDALVATWGGLGVLVGTALLLTSPALLRGARNQLLVRSARRTTGPPETLATRDLLRRWDWTTGEVLRSSTSVARRLVLVEERRGLLDELQRRDPTHFDAWVATAVPVRATARTRRGGDRPWRHGW